MQTFSESFCQAIGHGFRHDRIVVVMLSPEPVTQVLQTEPGGYREGTDVIGQAGLFRRDEVSQRPARLTAFPVSLLAEEVESSKTSLRLPSVYKYTSSPMELAGKKP